MAFGYSWDEQQQDPFESSFFQQPQASAPQPEPAPERDPFASSVFESPTLSRQAPADAGFGGGPSVRAPQRDDFQLREPRPATPQPGGQPQQPFDFSGLMDKVRTAVDPREKAIAQDSLARSTFQQLKQAGHDVKWQGDQLVVDGRPYVIGDGAQPAGGQPPVNDSRLRPDTGAVVDFQDTPNVARPHGATATGAAGAPTGGARTPQEAYDDLASSMDPNASPEEMQAAIEARFGHLPGYGGAYKESVMLNGRWYDMVVGYGGPGASWGGLTPKIDKPKMASSMFGGNDLMSSVLSPFGGSSGTGLAQGGAEGARGVELTAGLNPALLAYLQPPQPEPDPILTPSYMGLLR